MGLSTSLNTAIGGLTATQIGIGVVSENVANAGTTGYVRRVVSNSDSLSGATVGVQSTQVQRLLDKIVQHQLWQEAAGAGYTSTRASAMSNLDQLYGSPGGATALDTIYNNFTSALQGLQNDPSSYSLRSQVLDSAKTLASRLNTLSDGVQTLRSQAEAGIGTAVTKVNDLLAALTKVNARVVASPNDSAAASLQDQRDSILSELSQYVDIKTTEDSRGSVSVVTGSGVQLFDGQAAVSFSFDQHSDLQPGDQWSSDPAKRGVGTITMQTASGNSSDAIANNVFRSGSIAANIELRDKTLVQAQAQLDEVAAQMSKALSDREVPGTAVTGGFSADFGSLQPGNTLTLDYQITPGGQTRRFTFVNAAASSLPLPASASGDVNNQVIGVDFSDPASVQSKIAAAIGTGFDVAVSGSTVQITGSSAGTRSVLGLTGRVTSQSLSGPAGSAELPFFVDGSSAKVFTGSYDGGSQTVGYAGRIAVNPDLIADRSLLTVYSTSPATAQGDTTRPQLMLQRLTQSQRAFTNAVGLDGSTASSTMTLSAYVQRVVSSQGQAVETAKSLDQGQQVALASIQSRFQETAQVSVDREMSQLIELQNAYAANARIISTVKEMMDVLMRV